MVQLRNKELDLFRAARQLMQQRNAVLQSSLTVELERVAAESKKKDDSKKKKEEKAVIRQEGTDLAGAAMKSVVGRGGRAAPKPGSRGGGRSGKTPSGAPGSARRDPLISPSSVEQLDVSTTDPTTGTAPIVSLCVACVVPMLTCYKLEEAAMEEVEAELQDDQYDPDLSPGTRSRELKKRRKDVKVS